MVCLTLLVIINEVFASRFIPGHKLRYETAVARGHLIEILRDLEAGRSTEAWEAQAEGFSFREDQCAKWADKVTMIIPKKSRDLAGFRRRIRRIAIAMVRLAAAYVEQTPVAELQTAIPRCILLVVVILLKIGSRRSLSWSLWPHAAYAL